MNILSVESSSEVLSLAISFDDKPCCQFNGHGKFKSDEILGLLKKALKKARIKLEELDCIAVGLGPGSFTGLRIGIATALGLALPFNLRIIGIGSLDVIARNSKDSKIKQICAIVDAKRGNLYTCFFRKMRKIGDYLLLSHRGLLNKITSPTLFVGDGLLGLKQILEQEKKELAFFAPRNDWYPQASVLARIAYESIRKNKYKKKINQVLPIYLYPKECQIRNEKNKPRYKN